MTWSMAVLWKNGAAPTVVPGIRVGMTISAFEDLVTIYGGEIRLRIPRKREITYPGEPRRRRRIRADDDRVVVLLRGPRVGGAVGLDELPDGQRPHASGAADSVQLALCARGEIALAK